MVKEEVKPKIEGFIRENFMLGRPADYLRDSDSLLEKGVLDSTGVLELIGHIEETFDIAVADDEVTPECLGSINNIVGYILRKKTGVRASL